MAKEITGSFTEKEKYQEEVFDKKAGKAGGKRIYALGCRDNRNHVIKFRKLLVALQLKENDSLLEIGIGEGEHAYRFLKDTDSYYTGIDISVKTLEVAERRLQAFQGRYELKKDNANNLSFKDNTFDAVFCAATLHHMEEPFLTVSEMARVLKPNGTLALMEPNWIYPTNIGFAIFLKEDRNMWIMRRNYFYNWLKRAGLRNIKVENLIYTPPLPDFLIPLYDSIDSICSKVPIIRLCSLMLFGSGVK